MQKFDGDLGSTRCRFIESHETPWKFDPDTILALNVTLDGCFVPSVQGGARVDRSSILVIDNFFGERERQELLDFITEVNWDHSRGPPDSKWHRSTRDYDSAAPTWGLKSEVLRQFDAWSGHAKLEVQSRLCSLYPNYRIAHMPSSVIQPAELPSSLLPVSAAAVLQEQHVGAELPDNQLEGADQAGTRGDCCPFLANAATIDDHFTLHVDADPSTFAPSPWTEMYGHYFNREPGYPLFVSLILYLNSKWEREWGAETHFLDGQSGTGVLVQPKPYRAVLMDQDVLHRLSPPTPHAPEPRYSLVWKLVFLPQHASQECRLAQPEWGPPTAFGSAARLERLVMAARGRKRKAEGSIACPTPVDAPDAA